ncbi:hypothetical protein AX16_005812 [Volvariella volvacea WC 439]|nr:hypothetical protein AX16_005812 [Volvariella volvacea WC 439]
MSPHAACPVDVGYKHRGDTPSPYHREQDDRQNEMWRCCIERSAGIGFDDDCDVGNAREAQTARERDRLLEDVSAAELEPWRQAMMAGAEQAVRELLGDVLEFGDGASEQGSVGILVCITAARRIWCRSTIAIVDGPGMTGNMQLQARQEASPGDMMDYMSWGTGHYPSSPAGSDPPFWAHVDVMYRAPQNRAPDAFNCSNNEVNEVEMPWPTDVDEDWMMLQREMDSDYSASYLNSRSDGSSPCSSSPASSLEDLRVDIHDLDSKLNLRPEYWEDDISYKHHVGVETPSGVVTSPSSNRPQVGLRVHTRESRADRHIVAPQARRVEVFEWPIWEMDSGVVE